MKNIIFLCCLLACLIVSSDTIAQRNLGGHAIVLDNDATHHITIRPPPGLVNSYIWTLPLFPPPPNSAFSEAGTQTGQMLRWDNSLGYWVATSAIYAGGNSL